MKITYNLGIFDGINQLSVMVLYVLGAISFFEVMQANTLVNIMFLIPIIIFGIINIRTYNVYWEATKEHQEG